MFLVWPHHNSLPVSLFGPPTHSACRLLPTVHICSWLQRSNKAGAQHATHSLNCGFQAITQIIYYIFSSKSFLFFVVFSVQRSISFLLHFAVEQSSTSALFETSFIRHSLSASFIKVTACHWLQPASLGAHPHGHLNSRPTVTSVGSRAKSRGHFFTVPWMSNETVRLFVDSKVLLLFLFLFSRGWGGAKLTVALCHHI